MSDVRVLHVVGTSAFGGGAHIILPLAARARHEGWKVDILTTDPVFQGVIRESGEDIGIVDLNVIHRQIRPLRDTRDLWKLTRYLRAHPYTIVHTHTSKAGLLGRVAATFAGVPVIIHTVHGFAFHEASPRLEHLLYSAVERFAAHFCDRIVTVSRFHRDWALKLKIGNPEQVIAVTNGLSADRATATRSRAEMRQELGLADGELAIFSAGRLAPQKGFEYLLRAIPQLNRRLRCPFRIILAGEGELADSLKALSRTLGVERQVQFLGFRHDIGNLLAAADLVALPSLWEGLSIALLEAMAGRKPIITTRIGSNLETVVHEQTALLVEPANVEQLTEAIVRCALDPAWCAAMADRAHELFHREFTDERMLDNYLRVYRDGLAAKHVQETYAIAH